MQNIKDKVVLVTGGSKGIGYGIAEELLKQGAKLAITSRSKEAATDAARSLAKSTKNENVIGLQSDVRNYEDHQAAVTAIKDKWGQIDVVIANAGLGKFGSVEELSIDDWNQVIETNLTGVFYTIKSTVTELKKQNGYFITISSLAGTNFFPGGSAYNASKFGLTGFTQAVMLDLRDAGVNVSTIMPGSVASHFNDHEPNAEKDAWKIQVEDMGQIVIDLLKMHPRTLPSKIEVRPSQPPKK